MSAADPQIIWPKKILQPASIMPNLVPMSRSGGPSLGGLERVTRTDRGWWEIGYKGVLLKSTAQRRCWNAIRVSLSGRAGLLSVPVWSHDSTPWLAGTTLGKFVLPHAPDYTFFSDGSGYEQPGIIVELVDAVEIGDTSVKLRLIYGVDDFSGARFSYQHALYECGVPTAVDDDEWTMPIFPAVRAPIPADAELEFDVPTCLVRLKEDGDMDVNFSAGGFDKVDVSFVEAVDAWNDLASES